MAADAPSAPTYANDFACRVCGETKPYFYDWQRCYVCYLQAASKDFRLVPAVCQDCCRRTHPKPTHTK